MQQYSSLEGVSIGACWMTIGSFDGVHRGHQTLIRDMVQKAHQAGAKAVVLTFHPHPAVVLRGQNTSFYLTSQEEQAQLVSELGADYLITLPFTKGLAGLSAETFFSELQTCIQFKQIWIGRDFALGKDRQGDPSELKRIGEEKGFIVNQIPAVINGGEDISSSHIRALITAGDIEEAARQLGRWYFVRGNVIHGEGRGHGLGFPTANLLIPPERLLPAIGVYSCLAVVNDRQYPGVANIGVRPTFDDGQNPLRLEIHLLDFDQDIYGQPMIVKFVRRLRGETRFTRIEELVNQVNRDIQTTRGIFADGNRTPDLPA
jgi:riboflavin kinase/FMN adenylyltransferase